jgi:hypothetical protein
MTCNYAKERQLHELYVLGQLTNAEQSTYEAHVESCSECQAIQQEEMGFIAGIRAAGKADMKSEIMEQVEKVRGGTRWTVYAKVASIGFFLMLVPSLYYVYDQQLTKEEVSSFKMDYPVSDSKDEDRSQPQNEIGPPAPQPLEEVAQPSRFEKRVEASESESYRGDQNTSNRLAQAMERTMSPDLAHEGEELDDELRMVLSKPTDRLYFRRPYNDDVYVFQIGSETDKTAAKRQDSFEVTVERQDKGQFSISFDLNTDLYRIAEDSLRIVKIENGDMYLKIAAGRYIIKLDPSVSRGLLVD